MARSDIVALVTTLLTLVALLACGASLAGPAGFAALLAVAIWTARHLQQKYDTRASWGLRFVVLLLWFYSVHRWAGVVIDALELPGWERRLSRADHLLFGDDLSVLLEALATPLSVELGQWVYSSFYELILIPTGYLIWRGRREATQHVFDLLSVAHSAVVFGNYLVPARWPATLADHPELADVVTYGAPLQGLWGTERLRALLQEGTVMWWDSFPSGHTCLSIVMALAVRRYLPRAAWFTTPFAAGVVFTTVFLRYHYGVDLLAGAAVALITWWTIPRPGR